MCLCVCVVHLIHFQVISPDLSSHARWKWFPAFVLPCVTSLSKEKHSHLWLSHLFFSLSWQILHLIIQDYYVPVAGNPACANVLRVLLESCYETLLKEEPGCQQYSWSHGPLHKNHHYSTAVQHMLCQTCAPSIWWSERERKDKKLRETDDKQRNKRLGGRNEKQCRKKKENIKNKVDEVSNRVQTHIQSRGR